MEQAVLDYSKQLRDQNNSEDDSKEMDNYVHQKPQRYPANHLLTGDENSVHSERFSSSMMSMNNAKEESREFEPNRPLVKDYHAKTTEKMSSGRSPQMSPVYQKQLRKHVTQNRGSQNQQDQVTVSRKYDTTETNNEEEDSRIIYYTNSTMMKSSEMSEYRIRDQVQPKKGRASPYMQKAGNI